MTLPRVVLIGLRGSGKSTVGALLARLLGVPFHDTDRWIAARGPSPAELLRSGRLETLREREDEAVEALSDLPAAVLALGGGAIEVPGIRGRLAPWWAVLLEASDAELERRLTADPAPRPPLTERPLSEEIALLRARRSALYRELDPLIIATDARTPELIAERLARGITAALSGGRRPAGEWVVGGETDAP